MNNASIVLIVGETGCGNSTQIPQYILEDFGKIFPGSEADEGRLIGCTQPRYLFLERLTF